MRRKILFSLCTVALLGLGGCSVPWRVHVPTQETAPTSAGTGGIRSGSQAPLFSLADMGDSKQVTLKSLLSLGKPVILNAFASWCGPCNAEAPDLERIAKQFHNRVSLVGVNITDADSLANVKKFVQKYHLTYPILLDKNDQFADAYRVIALPTTYVIAQNGKVLVIHQGQLSAKQTKALFELAANS